MKLRQKDALQVGRSLLKEFAGLMDQFSQSIGLGSRTVVREEQVRDRAEEVFPLLDALLRKVAHASKGIRGQKDAKVEDRTNLSSYIEIADGARLDLEHGSLHLKSTAPNRSWTWTSPSGIDIRRQPEAVVNTVNALPVILKRHVNELEADLRQADNRFQTLDAAFYTLHAIIALLESQVAPHAKHAFIARLFKDESLRDALDAAAEIDLEAVVKLLQEQVTPAEA